MREMKGEGENVQNILYDILKELIKNIVRKTKIMSHMVILLSKYM